MMGRLKHEQEQLTADPGQIEHTSDPAHQVIVRYHLIQPELVEELTTRPSAARRLTHC